MSPNRRKSRIFRCPDAVRFVSCLWMACAFLSPVNSENFYTQGRYGKRQEARTSSLFLSGSRYGRNDGTVQRSGSKTSSEPLEVLPRVDRFYLGSRYGKRVPPRANVLRSFDRTPDILDLMNRAGNTYESSDDFHVPRGESFRRFARNSSEPRSRAPDTEELRRFAEEVVGAVEREIERESRRDEERESQRDAEGDSTTRR